MIPPIPTDLARLPLVQAVYPHGWEHLGGPLRWYELTSQIEPDDIYGHILRVKHVGQMGSLAVQISENREWPIRTLLFTGPAGTGKSAAQELLARTRLSKRLHPVTANLVNQDGENVTATFINENTNKPFFLNPDDTTVASREFVRRSMNTNNGDRSNAHIRAFNAATMSKDDFKGVLGDIRSLSFPITRFVVIVSEFDNLTQVQVGPLKDGLDPGKLPKGLLFMADSNHLDTISDRLKDAGMDRFQMHIHVNSWTEDDLAYYAKFYTDSVLNIQWDVASFAKNGAAPHYQIIAEACQGNFRRMLYMLQHMMGMTQPIHYDSLIRAINAESPSGESPAGSVVRFMHDIVQNAQLGEGAVGRFANTMRYQQNDLGQFVNGIARHILFNNPVVAEDAMVSAAFTRLRKIVHDYGDGIPHLRWAEAAHPIKILAEALAQKLPTQRSLENTPPSYRSHAS